MPPILDRPSEWDEHHSTFRELYWIEKKELPEVMRIMKAEHGFIATRKQYKKQIKIWRLEKNIKTPEMIGMLRIQKRRLDHENKETRFIRHGREVPAEKLSRFTKRHRMNGGDESELLSDENAATPPGIEYGTPEPEPWAVPLSASSDKSGDLSDDGSLEPESDATMLPDAIPEGVSLYGSHSPAAPNSPPPWSSDSNPFGYHDSQMSHTVDVGSSEMPVRTITAILSSDSHTHVTLRDNYSHPLSPLAFYVQTPNTSFITNNQDLTGPNGPWGFSNYGDAVHTMGPASPQEPAGTADEQYYDYPAGPAIHRGPTWTGGLETAQPEIIPPMQDFSCPTVSTMKNEAKISRTHSELEAYPIYPPGSDNILPCLAGHVVEHVDLDLESPALRHCSRLHYATIRGDMDLATTLLEGGEDPNPVAFGGMTPLHCAVFKRDMGLVRLLRKHGARLDAVTDQKQSILFVAVCGPDRLNNGDGAPQGLEIIKSLPVSRTDDNTIEAINTLFDCPSGWVPMLRSLEQPDREGVTPLMAAAENGFIRTAWIFLQRGARSDKKDYAGSTALKYAASCSHQDLVRLLLEADTRVQALDISHMLKLVIKNLTRAGVEDPQHRRASSSQSYQTCSDACCDGSAVLLELMARVYGEMGVLDKVIGLADQKGQIRVVEYLVNASQFGGENA